MGNLNLDYFCGYYEQPAETWRMFYGCEMYHAYDSPGRFIGRDGKEKVLVFLAMCKDDLPDTHGKNVEMCDFSLMDADLNRQPIMQALMQDPASALSLVPPCVQELLMKDFQAGKSAFEIAEERAGVLVPEFLGFTFEQVLAWRPDIMQPIVDAEGNESLNVQRCSLEEA